MKFIILILTASILIPSLLFSQINENVVALEKKIESIQKKKDLNKNQNNKQLDTTEATLWYLLSKENWAINPQNVRKYALKSLELSAKHNHISGIGDAYNSLGVLYYYEADYEKSKRYFELSADAYGKSYYKIGKVDAFNNIGNIYYMQGNFPKALESYYKAIKILKEIGNKNEEAPTLANISNIYEIQKKYQESIRITYEAISLRDSVNDKAGIAGDLNNLAMIYKAQNKSDQTIYYLNKSLKIYEQLNDLDGIAMVCGNIAEYYNQINNYNVAIKYASRAIEIAERLDLEDLKSSCYNIIGSSYLNSRDVKKAEYYFNKGLKIATELKNWEKISDAHGYLSELDLLKGNCNDAFMHFKFHKAAMDTMFNEESKTKLMQTEIQFEFDNKALILKAEQDKKDLIAKKEIQNQKFIRNGLIAGLSLVLIFTGVFFNQRNKIKKGKKISDELLISVSSQKTEVEKQRNIVEFQNKEILSSIEYAKRIQATILPPLKVVEKHLEDSFVLYIPKDIVAGDFYWMENAAQEEGLVLIAACDCTGHGVPGAMVSVVCSNALNRTVKESNIIEPGLILDRVAKLVVSDFSKDENENVQDGMDASLCALNTKTGKLQWAGANNPLFIISDGKLTEIKGDKQPIGKIDNLRPFKTNYLDTKKGDTFYLFTDGYSDQFGGPENKKLTKKKFKELLVSIQHLSMNEQRNYLYDFHLQFRGNHEQVDDILIIGIRV
jgi:serine phosphatase RsbU (regulator of sigma subunit)